MFWVIYSKQTANRTVFQENFIINSEYKLKDFPVARAFKVILGWVEPIECVRAPIDTNKNKGEKHCFKNK